MTHGDIWGTHVPGRGNRTAKVLRWACTCGFEGPTGTSVRELSE